MRDPNLTQLLNLGAECVGGSVIWKRKTLGLLRDGALQLTDDGRAALNVVDVEAKETPAPVLVVEKPTRPRKIRQTTAEDVAAPASASVVDPDFNLDIDIEA